MAKLKPGDKIGPFPYQIVKQLGKGQGNMSDVYLAKEGERPDAPLVVLKISRANSDHSDFFTDTIYNESERLRQLSHPGIVHLLPIKTNSSSMRAVPYVANASLPGRPWFLVLEHLAGSSLDEILSSGKRMQQLLALRVAQRLAATLDYIHRCGQVHLDIKPENILFRRPLDPEELPDPVLIDFGISRNVGQDGLEARTLHYAPPERVMLHKTNVPLELLAKPAPSMDVYSLGVVLYQMLTGRRPYEGHNDKRISSAILNSNPTKPSVYAGDLDRDVEEIVLQTMAKDPAARPSAGELAQRLEAIAVRKAYSEPARVVTQGKSIKPATSKAANSSARRRTGLVVAGGVAFASVALVLTLGATNPQMLTPLGLGSGLGSGSGGTGQPGDWWRQLRDLLPGTGAGAASVGTPIAWVTPTVTVTATPTSQNGVAMAPTSTPAARATATDTVAPTSTPVARNTNTPTPMPTAIVKATSTAVPTAAPATPTVPPTVTNTATPTRAPATSTPAVRGQSGVAIHAAAAAASTEAVVVPGNTGIQNGGKGQSTPVPARATNTPTPKLQPTATSLPQAGATAVGSVAAKNTPAPTPDLSSASVRLVEPIDGHTGHGVITFRWETKYQLQDNQAYEVVFWRAGSDPLRDGRGWAGYTRNLSSIIDWDEIDVAADAYLWGVLLVNMEPYERIHYMGGGNRFQFTGPN